MNVPNTVSGTVPLHCKSRWNHIESLTVYWKRWTISFFSLFGILWSAVEASSFFLAFNPRGSIYYGFLLLTSFCAATVYVIYFYMNDSPEGLQDESATAKRIAQLQRPKWEFHLTHQLLLDRVGPLLSELSDLLDGRKHVSASKITVVEQYMTWLQSRIDNLLSMVEVAKRVLVHDLVQTLVGSSDTPVQPLDILKAINNIRDLYIATIQFEREGRAIIPPEWAREMHELQLGWSEPIRNGIHQLFEFLILVIEPDIDDETPIKFEIVFEEPTGIDEYVELLNSITSHLPEIISDPEMEWNE